MGVDFKLLLNGLQIHRGGLYVDRQKRKKNGPIQALTEQ